MHLAEEESTYCFTLIELWMSVIIIVGSNNFSAQFINIISHYKKIDRL